MGIQYGGKRADQIVVGDIVPGGNAPKGHIVTEVTHGKIDNMLGLVVVLTVQEVAQDVAYQALYPKRDYIFHPHDLLMVESMAW